MSTPYTPVAIYHTQIDVTVDGDLANAGEFNTPYQQCADNAAFCKGVIDPLISGGTLSPTAKLFLDQSFEISGGNSLTVTGGIECFGFFECLSSSGSHFVGDMTCDAAVNCATLSCSGDAAVGGNLTVTGNETLLGSLTVVGAANLENTATGTQIAKLGNALSYGAIGTLRGRAPRRPLLGTTSGIPAAHAQVAPAQYDWVVWVGGSLTSNVYWDIDESFFTPSDGDWIQFTNIGNGTNTVTIYQPNGVTAMGTVGNGTSQAWVVRILGTWYWAGAL